MFEKHKFLMIYRIEGNQVIVDGMFHELQDYDGIFARELHLGKRCHSFLCVRFSSADIWGERNFKLFYKKRGADLKSAPCATVSPAG